MAVGINSPRCSGPKSSSRGRAQPALANSGGQTTSIKNTSTSLERFLSFWLNRS